MYINFKLKDDNIWKQNESKYLNNKHQLFIISEIKGLLIFNDNGDEMPLKTYSCVYNVMIYVNRTVSSSYFITLDANMY